MNITRLNEMQLAEAGQVLGQAFWNDPMTLYFLPDEAHRSHALAAFFEVGARYGYLFGEVYAAQSPLKGVGVWLPPDSGDMSEERMAAAGMETVASAFGEEAMGRFMTFMETIEAHRSRVMEGAPHWYLLILGVGPEHQRQGVGDDLIRIGTEKADAASLPCYLDTTTTQNVDYYRKRGFEVAAEADLPDGGPRCWAMRCDPR